MATGSGTAATGAATATGGAAGEAVSVGWPKLELPVGGGEDYLTLGQKLCPLCVFTIAGLEKDIRKGCRNELE